MKKKRAPSRDRAVRVREGLTDRAIFTMGIIAGAALAVLSLFSPTPARMTQQVTGIGAPPPPPLEFRARSALAAGNLDEALELYARAAKNRPDDARIAYNHACVLSLIGETDRAILELDRSVTLGYADSEHLLEDDDLTNLHGSEEFARVAARSVARDPQHQLDFLVGMWEVRNEQGEVVAQSDVMRLHNGRLYLEAWKTDRGEETAILTFDAETGIWDRARVADDGTPRWRFTGKVDDSGELVMTAGPPSQEATRRIRFCPLPDGTIHRFREGIGTDGAWQIDDTFVYVRTTGGIWKSRAADPVAP